MYKHLKLTKLSCYLGYLIQGLVNMFLPLLFNYFNTKYGISKDQLTIVSMYNFILQITANVGSSLFVEKLGYKKVGILGNSLVIVGLLLLALLPNVAPPLAGIFIATTFFSCGAGLIEIVISPVITTIPVKHKAFELAIANSSYCFGAFIAIIVSFFFFLGPSMDYWWILALLFSIIPIFALILFFICDYPKTITKEEKEHIGTPFYKKPIFYIICFMILFSGGSETGLSQWISTYAETVMLFKKPFCDLYCSATFILVMGLTRVAFGFLSKKVNLKLLLFISGVLCGAGYILTSLSNIVAIEFIGIILVGIGVASLWPGTVSLAETFIPMNGKAYSFLAFSGHIGCTIGTNIVGLVYSGINLRMGILCGAILPLSYTLLCFLVIYLTNKHRVINNSKGNE